MSAERSGNVAWPFFFFKTFKKITYSSWTLMAVNNYVHQIFIEHLLCAKHLGARDRNVNKMVRSICLHQASYIPAGGEKT